MAEPQRAAPPGHRGKVRVFLVGIDQLRQLTNPSPAEQPMAAPARPWAAEPKVWLAACAAALVVAVAAGGFLRAQSAHPQQIVARNQLPVRPPVASHPSGPQTYATAVGAQKKFALADGTMVMLNTNSQIEVNFRPDHRDVRLVRGRSLFRGRA